MRFSASKNKGGKEMGIDTKGKRVALISVYNKAGIEEVAKELVGIDWLILSSGGTAKTLAKAGVPVTDVADLISGSQADLLEKFLSKLTQELQSAILELEIETIEKINLVGKKLIPDQVSGGAILGHRVVTLSRVVHAGLLARRIPEDIAEMEKLGIPFIDMVICDFYPMKDIIAKPGASIDSVVEMTDIGGPTMVRSAAKGGRIVICDVADRQWVLDELKTNDGNLTPEHLQWMRAKAEITVANYCLDSARFHGQGKFDGISMKHERKLAYAENKCQNPADHFVVEGDDPLALHQFKVDAGDPSYTAMADFNGILEIMCTLNEAFRRSYANKVPCIVIAGKHGNPCGAAIDWNSPKVAIEKALLGDKVAVLGGEVITNFPITDELGQALYAPDATIDIGRKNWGLDLIVAPEFSQATIELLGKKEKRRLLSNPNLTNPTLPKTEWQWKPVRGGFLRQKQYPFVLTPTGVKEWVGAPLTDDDFATLLIAQTVCWKASSNTVALAKNKMLIGLGCGQQDRIACVRLCLDRANRAGHDTNGAMFASDGFFPYASSTRPNFAGLMDQLAKMYDNAYLQLKTGAIWDLGKTLFNMAKSIIKSDNREGPELLIDAGCKGGVVPADGQKLPEVQELFKKAGLSVAFIAPEFRGFAKH